MAHLLVDPQSLEVLAQKHLGLTKVELGTGVLMATKKGTGSDSDLVVKIADINSAIAITFGDFSIKASRISITPEGLKLEFGLSA